MRIADCQAFPAISSRNPDQDSFAARASCTVHKLGKNLRMESDGRFVAGSALIWSRSKLSVDFAVDVF